jgi:hypothetical protein
VEYQGWDASVQEAFSQSTTLTTRSGKKWNRRNPPEVYARMLLNHIKNYAPFSNRVKDSLMLFPSVGLALDLYHGIDGVISNSKGKPLVTLDLTTGQKSNDGYHLYKADVVVRESDFTNQNDFLSLMDRIFEAMTRNLQD